ncbi:MAG: KH domain-containing protein [Clostridiales bacterium]|nr:KH domain-containing protein [Clostridiales bacterium]
MADLELILTDIAKAIVDEPDKVSVKAKTSGHKTELTLSVAPDDMGRVIGRHGRIALAIRSVMKAAANVDDRRVTVEIK